MKKTAFWLMVFFVGLGLVEMRKLRGTTETPLLANPTSPAKVSVESQPAHSPLAAAGPRKQSSPAKTRALGEHGTGSALNLFQQLPRLAQLQAQVRRNPHETPRAMVAFAYMVGERLGPALEKEEQARQLFRELENCATSSADETVPSVRGFCVVNAKKLAKKFPSLRRDFVTFTARVDGEALQLAERLSL